MAKDPAFLFYSQDFYTGVAELTFEERGQFISILCLMHQKGRLKEETIRFLVGSVSVNLKSKFGIDENGLWFNKRLEAEISARANFVNSRKANGLKGGRPKNEKPTGYPTGNLMEDANENTNEDEIKDRNENFLIPKMFERFKKVIPTYPGSIKKDFKPLFSIYSFLVEQGNLNGSLETHTEKILPVWDRITEVIAADNFYKSKSLLTISNHIQEIIQIGRNGKSNGKVPTGGNVDTRSAFEKIDRMPDSNRGTR